MTEFALHAWTITAALLCVLSCALLGTFLVLRKASLLGDAISHAILPGLAAAFLLTGTRNPIAMLLGASVFGLLTAFTSQFLATTCRVDRGASLGVVFTSLFALGVVLIRQAADKIDLDPGCVLYGLLEFVPLDLVAIGAWEIPRAVLLLGGALILNVLFVWLFWKELKITSFDPQLATSLGLRSNWIHYLLMVMVTLTSVASFEAVGSILVVAMFIVPVGTARFLSNRLFPTLLLSLLLAAVSAVGGYALATETNTSVAGAIAVASGVLFGITALFAPKFGIVGRAVERLILRIRIASEDALGILYRVNEDAKTAGPITARSLASLLGGGFYGRAGVMAARVGGEIHRRSDGLLVLTDKGKSRAEDIVRRHRLWETVLVDRLGLRPDHVHGTATRLEHFPSADIDRELLTETEGRSEDPHGRIIPK